MKKTIWPSLVAVALMVFVVCGAPAKPGGKVGRADLLTGSWKRCFKRSAANVCLRISFGDQGQWTSEVFVNDKLRRKAEGKWRFKGKLIHSTVDRASIYDSQGKLLVRRPGQVYFLVTIINLTRNVLEVSVSTYAKGTTTLRGTVRRKYHKSDTES